MEVCRAQHVAPAPSSAWSLLTALESVLDGMPEHDPTVAARAWNEGFTAALLQVQYGMGRQRNPYEHEGTGDE